ncbi:uncharacterized protein FFB20_05026 [Fusarium fujikuroi]|uniref:Integral membrane protein n=2 Tax=Fusarium fujikuroi TaxID=5127 RepID=S0EII2_GIBF5|nr:uncharacterized protein FFUJ_09531 [Fusarium fujikuroi IMI 58289]KLO79621.1 uncharacterized protein LW93_13316 [Fusarium fujikuroi]KLP07916.1 uncharacterized protein Y057_228 [Fusarium fujikuroi]KLP14276.1 uncharacterized protein LW94_14023 [Fusarium fujikuroi]QGI69283.1 hypothetical protein CEK27_013254 [Fusarium fujikuroi]QGJ00172.1 hypothetical protein CEK26_013240 [Fusarium fujikuroi]
MAPTHKTPFALILTELAISTTAVTLFGLMYPVEFRSRLWESGGEQGWNSNPNKRIYYYANHQEPPEVPLIWSQRLYTSNLAIAILGLVVFFARTAMSHLRYLPRCVNNIYDAILLGLWAVSIAGQTSSDFTDPEHPSPHPWYLTRGCSAAWNKTQGYCQIAQASFAMSVIAAILYGARLIREAMLTAYERGQRHQSKWSVRDVQEVESIAGVYLDEGGESEAELTTKEDWQSMALSPVLAFFPSSDNRW